MRYLLPQQQQQLQYLAQGHFGRAESCQQGLKPSYSVEGRPSLTAGLYQQKKATLSVFTHLYSAGLKSAFQVLNILHCKFFFSLLLYLK